MDVQMAQESLAEHRNAIVRVLDALDAQTRPTRATSGEPAQTPQPPEYKGVLIQPTSTPSSPPSLTNAAPLSSSPTVPSDAVLHLHLRAPHCHPRIRRGADDHYLKPVRSSPFSFQPGANF